MSSTTEITAQSDTLTENPLASVHIAFVGAGVMAEAIFAGLLRQGLVSPSQICGSHPRQARREELASKYGIGMFEHNADAATAGQAHYPESIVVLAIKP